MCETIPGPVFTLRCLKLSRRNTGRLRSVDDNYFCHGYIRRKVSRGRKFFARDPAFLWQRVFISKTRSSREHGLDIKLDSEISYLPSCLTAPGRYTGKRRLQRRQEKNDRGAWFLAWLIKSTRIRRLWLPHSRLIRTAAYSG